MTPRTPEDFFQAAFYLRHNQRRLEHLASLRLPLRQKTVLEVGAGIGDHTGFFLDRECVVTSIEARPENAGILAARYPMVKVVTMDLDMPDHSHIEQFDIVYCYGLLYHLRNPDTALEWMAKRCGGLFLLESCVSYGSGPLIQRCTEDPENPTQAFSGTGCRPTRDWVLLKLRELFDYAYVTVTQPNHEEFPTDWTATPVHGLLSRSVFIGSRSEAKNDQLTDTLPMQQPRH